MTDEEMAEEYVKKEGFRSGMFGELDNITSSEANKEIKQAYLAGLHEGQPKWHDLRKDPNDLPKVVKEYITNIGVMTFDRLKDRHLWTTPCCDACDYYEEVTDEVIAWCEIPTFDKE